MHVICKLTLLGVVVAWLFVPSSATASLVIHDLTEAITIEDTASQTVQRCPSGVVAEGCSIGFPTPFTSVGAQTLVYTIFETDGDISDQLIVTYDEEGGTNNFLTIASDPLVVIPEPYAGTFTESEDPFAPFPLIFVLGIGNVEFQSDTERPHHTPEPSTVLLFGIGLAAAKLGRRKQL